MPFSRATASELNIGDVFFHGYGYGTFERYTEREHDVIVHYRSTESGRKRSVRAIKINKFVVLRRASK